MSLILSVGVHSTTEEWNQAVDASLNAYGQAGEMEDRIKVVHHLYVNLTKQVYQLMKGGKSSTALSNLPNMMKIIMHTTANNDEEVKPWSARSKVNLP